MGVSTAHPDPQRPLPHGAEEGRDSGAFGVTGMWATAWWCVVTDTTNTLDLPFLAAVTNGLDAALSRL